MRLFLKITYQIPHDEACGILYKRMRNFFLDVYELKKRWFRFDDSFLSKHRGSSAVIQKFPELKEFLYFRKREWGNQLFEEPVLSNLDETWMTANPYQNLGNLSEEKLVTIIQNVPKFYPFIRFSIAFDFHISSMLDSISDKEYPVRPSYKREFVRNAPLSDSTLVFECDLTEQQKRNYMTFYLRLPNQLYYAEKFPDLPASILTSIRGIGSVSTSEIYYISDEIEYSRMESKKADAHHYLGDFGKNLYDELIQVKKPNVLPDPFFVLQDSMHKSKKKIPKIPKESIVKLCLGLKGYHYRPKLDSEESITLVKSTKNHNVILVVFHFGSWSKKLSCTAILKGLAWEEQIQIPFYPDYNQYPIASEETFKQAVENIAAVVLHLEKNIIPEIEKIYGSSPAWFRADGNICKIKDKDP